MSAGTTKPIVFSAHARDKMTDRGTTEREVELAIRNGDPEPARRGRLLFRHNLAFGQRWRDKEYAVEQVAPLVAEEPDRLIVVTVFVSYF